MQLIQVSAAALNQTPLDWEGNRQRIVSAIRQARDAGSSVLCLPELCITGYGCEDRFLSPDLWRQAGQSLLEILPETRDMAVCLGLPLFHQSAVYNCAALVVDGELLGFVPKQNLAGDGLHYEPRWFKPGRAGDVSEVLLNGQSFPFGDLIFDCGGVRVGFEICEDAWVARRPGTRLALAGADLILNPSASHFAFGKQAIRNRYIQEGSRTLGVAYVYANLLGNEAGRAIYDGGTAIARGGLLVAVGERFSYEDCRLITAVVDIERQRMQRASIASFLQADHQNSPTVVSSDFVPRASLSHPTEEVPTEQLNSATSKEMEFTQAVTLGLFDYLRKSHSRGCVVSLSGGADSAAVALLVRLMWQRAWRELGSQGVQNKLPAIDVSGKSEDWSTLVEKTLICVYQATQNSSDETRSAARQLAAGLGATFHEWEIDQIVAAYQDLAAQAVGRELIWDTDDVALQNIQARVRSPGVWLLANLHGFLLLATGNRSESSVGYATMDGDTSGGLAPIAGIDKAFLRHWLHWMETEGLPETGAFPCLQSINTQIPTAELRPLEASQTDESDLMPYEILDVIERAAIRDRLGPAEVFATARAAFPGWEPRQLATFTEKFFRLWARNQWKRERLAPSFHLDDENVDPRTWCRFPILSGGFEHEIAQMRDTVDREFPMRS